MRISPLDIQNHRFRSSWRGFDPDEVETFLGAVAEDYAALVLEAASRSDQTRRLEARLEELTLNEALLKETLVTAQNLGDELRNTAEREARIRVSEAEVKAEKLLDAAHRRVGQLGEQIREMQGLRARLASGLRSTLETQLALVDALAGDPRTDQARSQAETLEAHTGSQSNWLEPRSRNAGSESD